VPEKSSLRIERLRKAGHLAQTISPIYPKCSRIEVFPRIRDAIPDLINGQWGGNSRGIATVIPMAQPRILAKLPPSTRVTSRSYARYHPRLRKYKDGFAGLDMQRLRTEGACEGESCWTTANNYNVTIFLPYRVCSRVQKLSPWYFGKCSAMRIVCCISYIRTRTPHVVAAESKGTVYGRPGHVRLYFRYDDNNPTAYIT